MPAVPAFALLRVKKGIYGLSEAPRLWYLRAKRDLEVIGWRELRSCRAVFTCQDETGTVCGVLALHVDDGIMAGDMTNPAYISAKKKIDEYFKIKEWKRLQQEGADYLGMRIVQRPDFSVEVDMDNYINELESIPVRRGDDVTRVLSESEKGTLRSNVMKLAWPARKILPQVLYDTSVLASAINKATVGDVKAYNAAVVKAKKAVTDGTSKFYYKAIDLKTAIIVTTVDASFANEAGRRSQLGFVTLISDEGILKGYRHAGMLEFASNKIQRVVRSTMAAESAALSMATDRQLYARALWQALTTGEPHFGPRWREELMVHGYLVTDARSLFDHLTTTGSLPTERQVLLDLLAVRELLDVDEVPEDGRDPAKVHIKWVPSKHQLSDPLTKCMESDIMVRYLSTAEYSLIEDAIAAATELRLAALRKEQRQRGKIKKRAAAAAGDALNVEE